MTNSKSLSLLVQNLLSFVLSWYYRQRYRQNLTIEPKVQIAGKLKLSGSVKVTIKSGTRIRKRNHFFGEGNITIGSDCLLNGCSIGCYQQVDIGDFCLISDCYILDTDYHNVDPDARHEPLFPSGVRPVSIGKNVWVGAGARVLKGVTIGENSVVGLGCIVRRNVPANVVVIGNPERIVKHLQPQKADLLAGVL